VSIAGVGWLEGSTAAQARASTPLNPPRDSPPPWARRTPGAGSGSDRDPHRQRVPSRPRIDETGPTLTQGRVGVDQRRHEETVSRVGVYGFLEGAVLWFGMRESAPNRNRPPQTGQTPVSRLAPSWLMLDGFGGCRCLCSYLQGRSRT
jgi:hypothetical protein